MMSWKMRSDDVLIISAPELFIAPAPPCADAVEDATIIKSTDDGALAWILASGV